MLTRIYFIILSLIALPSCSVLMDWQTKFPDNDVENKIEDIIESSTGLKIDLTPFSLESEDRWEEKRE